MCENRKQIRVYQDEKYKKLGDLFGIFFEDINHAADGGLYAELIQNRSFEYCEADRPGYHFLTAWDKSADTQWEVRSDSPLNRENTHYLAVLGNENGWIRNLGYNTGLYIEPGKRYCFSAFARVKSSVSTVRIMVRLEDDAHRNLAEESLCLRGDHWEKYELVLLAEQGTVSGRLVIAFTEECCLELDMISLFPQDTFMGRKNGMRRDIAQILADLKPGFMRFPGGCLTHSGSLKASDRDSMYRWECTLGKVEERTTWKNIWGYNQTLGLGFYEYFCFCEDIGTKPLPVLPGGFNPHTGVGVPVGEIGDWVQEALDLIEFANGGTDTPWGSRRAELGHPEPFGLEYIGIGNEEVGNGFFERYEHFHNAIRDKYPGIKIVNTAGPFAAGESYEAGWNSAKKHGSDLVDEHYYAATEWYLANMHHYEDYDVHGPKVFLGEYASWGNMYYNALVEAAYMTHLERSEVVALACYAPLLCNVDYVNWKPDLIWFNNHMVMKTPNYYVQKLFMEHQGTDEIRFDTKNLEEVIPLVEPKEVVGELAIAGNDIAGRIWDIQIEDHDKNSITEIPGFSVDTGNQPTTLGRIKSGHYTLSFRFKRSEGRKGLCIYFGKKDEKKQFVWEFGGWDNWDCNLTSMYNGASSSISQRLFHVEDKEYYLQLTVKGREITTRVNGEIYNHITDRLPQLEELYISASVDDAEGRTIVKAVNLTGEEKVTELVLEGARKTSVKVFLLEGYELTAENSFENPDYIQPKCKMVTVCDNRLEYAFAPHSVTVFSFLP